MFVSELRWMNWSQYSNNHQLIIDVTIYLQQHQANQWSQRDQQDQVNPDNDNFKNRFTYITPIFLDEGYSSKQGYKCTVCHNYHLHSILILAFNGIALSTLDSWKVCLIIHYNLVESSTGMKINLFIYFSVSKVYQSCTFLPLQIHNDLSTITYRRSWKPLFTRMSNSSSVSFRSSSSRISEWAGWSNGTLKIHKT